MRKKHSNNYKEEYKNNNSHLSDKNIEINQLKHNQISCNDSNRLVISFEANANNQNNYPCKFCSKVLKSFQSRHKHTRNVHNFKLNE